MTDLPLDDGTIPAETRVPVTDGEIYEALNNCRGNLSAAAKEVGLRRNTLKARVEKSVTLVALLDDLREGAVDQAEQNQFNDVDKGDGPASRFILTTLGKDRGYTTGVQGSGKNGEIVVQIARFAEEA